MAEWTHKRLVRRMAERMKAEEADLFTANAALTGGVLAVPSNGVVGD